MDLSVIPGLILPAPLSIDVAGLLANAAAGAPITLQVIASDGTLVGPASQCNAAADGYTLNTPAGIGIGGNRITGLGATGQEATAGEINSIAMGNRAATAATATNSIAIGPDASVGINATGGVALGSAASVTAANGVALGAGSLADRAPLAGYAAFGLATPQTSIGAISVGTVGGERQITNVAPGSAPTDAANLAQLQGIAALIPSNPVTYDDPTHTVVTFTGAGGTLLTKVLPGALNATSSDAINGSQLFATNQQVQLNTTAIANLTLLVGGGGGGALPLQYSNAATPTTTNGGIPTNDTTLVGAAAGAVGLHNVADGVVAVGSTDAVNGGQLATTNAAVVAAQTTADSALALGQNSVQYDNAGHTSVTFTGAGGTTLTNVKAGTVAAGSTDAVNGSQLFATNQLLANNTTSTTNNTTAITNLSFAVANGGIGPVQYSNPGTPTTPNGGLPTNDLTLVGAAAAPVALHNVANGTIAAGSTDAVNGGQIFGLSLSVQNAVTYNTDVNGNRTNTVTLVGGNPAAPVTVTNVAPGAVNATSTDATNGAQLYIVQQATVQAQATADQALVLNQNAVTYDDSSHTSVSLDRGGSPAALHNVANGTANTDAVNLGQLNSIVSVANAYTDSRFTQVNFDLRQSQRDARSGSAAALAAAALPQPIEAGGGMISAGVGTYRGRTAFAVGASKVLTNGKTIMKLGMTYDSSSHVGANAGVGFGF